jgi:hypothetical protein
MLLRPVTDQRQARAEGIRGDITEVTDENGTITDPGEAGDMPDHLGVGGERPRTRPGGVLADKALWSRVRSGYCGGMGLLGDLIKTVSGVVTSGRRRGEAPPREAGRRPASTPTARSSSSSSMAAAHGHPARQRARSSRADAKVSPGEFGPDATVEADPHRIGPVRMSYSPQTDGAPDPGEVVWTWVPFEENDGRGKDRPVLVVAVESAGTYLAVQLTSKDHDGEGDFVSVGAGGWDGEHRPSWVDLDRVIRVHEGGMRREAAALPREPFERVTGRLHQRYGWR